MKHVRLASVMLAAAMSAVVPLAAQTASSIRDSVGETLLSAEQLVHYEAAGIALPSASTVLGKKLALIQAHREVLASVGVVLEVTSNTQNMDGDPEA